jgi:type II secretory pathway pseudopilin PulG
MKVATLLRHPRRSTRAFSLVEVVVALGIAVFVLVVLLGLFGVGLKINGESKDQIEAGNLASLIISDRLAAPTNQLNMTNLAIPVAALTNGFTNAFPGNQLTSYVGPDGMLTNQANAAYIMTCKAGTNTFTGPNVAQVYLMLSWPAQASPANATASEHYEVTTYIPFR